jgi:hypothetical protein
MGDSEPGVSWWRAIAIQYCAHCGTRLRAAAPLRTRAAEARADARQVVATDSRSFWLAAIHARLEQLLATAPTWQATPASGSIQFSSRVTNQP